MIQLTEVEARVLGSLIEKDMTTPEYYPLSLNALTAACNQKTNREPVVQYDEDFVGRTLESLREKQLAWSISGRDMRVPKYSHRASETLDAGNRELAVICVLLLRGPQTVGELKQRTERLYAFDDLESVETTLHKLAEREPAPFVRQLARVPGTREPRWAHLFCGEVDETTPAATAQPASEPLAARVARLEEEVRLLKEQVADLRRLFE